MTARSSVSRISFRRRPGQFIRPAVLLLSLIALSLAALVVWSFITADQVMRQEPVPLTTFSSNVMPPFSVVSFPSLDEQTMLYGWFMKADPAVSTIILVHDQGKNRLQFDLDTPRLYHHLVGLGFNVLAFDLRNTGQSEGHLSGFGYAEWADVLAAVRHVRRHAATTDVILYGFGTGVSASLIAWNQLPTPDSDKDGLAKEIAKLDFDQSYVIGLILDSPSASPDDEIRALYREDSWLRRQVLSRTVPYAVRLSAGGIGAVHHSTVLGACHIPVALFYHETETHIDSAAGAMVASERKRLHPDLTFVQTIGQPGHTDGFLLDETGYLAGLDQYLNRFFLQQGP